MRVLVCVCCFAQVLYDPSETTYENLLRIFFSRHDPTQVNGQGNDTGTQYRAGVYFHDEEQVSRSPLPRVRKVVTFKLPSASPTVCRPAVLGVVS